MSKKLNKFVKVHEIVHFLKPYTVKIYDANGDISKEWYIWWSFRNPVTGKMERQTNIKAGCNAFKDKASRYNSLKKFYNYLIYELERGFNPYVDEPLKKLRTEEVITYSFDESVNYFIDIRKKTLSSVAIRDYKSVLKIFKDYLDKNNIDTSNVNNITRKTVINFLNQRLKDTSSRTRNNNQINLSAFWEYLKNEEITEKNILEGIPKVKSQPKKHKVYTPEQFDVILKELDKTNKQLSLYVKFVAYLFVRPVENCRISIGDIDFVNRTIIYKSKTKNQQIKYIIDLIYNDLVNLKLDQYPKEFSLFSPEGKPSLWKIANEEKRNFFTKQFKNLIKKDKVFLDLGLSPDHDIYSFRHTGVVILYRNFRKTLSPFEAKSILMLITGHSTMSALEKYLRDINAELPEDYSHLFKQD